MTSDGFAQLLPRAPLAGPSWLLALLRLASRRRRCARARKYGPTPPNLCLILVDACERGFGEVDEGHRSVSIGGPIRSRHQRAALSFSWPSTQVKTMTQHLVMPILPCNDIDATQAFYERLGFALATLSQPQLRTSLIWPRIAPLG